MTSRSVNVLAYSLVWCCVAASNSASAHPHIAVTMKDQGLKTGIGVFFFVVALIFVYRSFYAMRIPEEDAAGTDTTTS